MNSSSYFLRKWSFKELKESKHFDCPSLSLPLPQGKLCFPLGNTGICHHRQPGNWFIKVTERKFTLFFSLSEEKVVSLLEYPLTSSQKWDDICRLSSLSTLVPVPTFGCGNQVIREKQTHPKLCLQKPFLCANNNKKNSYPGDFPNANYLWST